MRSSALEAIRPAGPDAPTSAVAAALRRARRAQQAWRNWTPAERLAILRRFRHLLAEHGRELAAAARPGSDRPSAEALTAEVLPLAEACRFLEREGEGLLAPRGLGTARRPIWLAGTRVELHREPLGVVLVIGPSNYPLFLPGAQALQALCAGNAVVLKPGRGGSAAARLLSRLLVEAGLEPDLCPVLDESPESARQAVAQGVDKVLLTGSASTGRALLADLAPRLTPATLELSGCDAVFVLDDADLELAASALAFGLSLNGGATCIAPRRVLVSPRRRADLEELLRDRLEQAPPVRLDSRVAERARALIEQALARGARSVVGGPPDAAGMRPTVLAALPSGLDILEADLFAPVLSLIEAEDAEEALELAHRCPYALGAAIFGSESAAGELAGRVDAGVVVINDVIVPTADPRVPFGGRGESGYGVTRGAEGLLELTRIKAITARSGKRRPHLDEQPADSAELFLSYLETAHGGSLRRRTRALRDLIRAAVKARPGQRRKKRS